MTYVVRGLARTVAMVGDAIFAGSMGGGGVSYKDALKTNREGILSCLMKPFSAPAMGLSPLSENKRKLTRSFPSLEKPESPNRTFPL